MPKLPKIDPVAFGISAAFLVLALLLLTDAVDYRDVFGLKGVLLAGSAGGVGYYGATLIRDRFNSR